MRTIITATAIAVMTAAAPATAQPACGPRDAIVEALERKYGETRQGMGLQDDSGVVEIFASAETGTWTILVTLPSGIACLVSAGENWQRFDAPLAGDPA